MSDRYIIVVGEAPTKEAVERRARAVVGSTDGNSARSE